MFFESKQIYDRIDKLRLDRGWSIYHLAELANVSVNSLYSWRDRHSSPTLYMVESIATAFEINPINLLLSREDIAAIDTEQRELLDRWNTLSSEQKDSMMSMLRSFTRQKD